MWRLSFSTTKSGAAGWVQAATERPAAFTVHTLQRTSIPLPVDTSLVTPVRVSVDGSAEQQPLYRTAQNQLWLLVPEGAHRVELEVFLPAVNQLQIPLPLRPR